MSYHFKDFEIDSGKSKKAPNWVITFYRKNGSAKITMRIPTSGIFDDPNSTKELSKADCVKLAGKIALILCSELR